MARRFERVAVASVHTPGAGNLIWTVPANTKWTLRFVTLYTNESAGVSTVHNWRVSTSSGAVNILNRTIAGGADQQVALNLVLYAGDSLVYSVTASGGGAGRGSMTTSAIVQSPV